MKYINYDNKPSAFAAVGNGSHLYRWSIEEIESFDDNTQSSRTSWRCYEVVVSGTLSKDNTLKAVVAALWGDGVEQKLLNDYQAAMLGVLDESYITAYLEFLAERKAMKELIEVSF